MPCKLAIRPPLSGLSTQMQTCDQSSTTKEYSFARPLRMLTQIFAQL